jgi:type VI secretion system protein ImpM
MPDPAVSAFLFGKMPAHGDFVARGISAAERSQWDDWLTLEMQSGNAAHGETFADLYTRAPAWRFVAGGRSGVLACSIDSVGRKFPLVAGRVTAAPSDAAAEACEEQLYAAFEQGWTADVLIDYLAAIPLPETGDAVSDRWWTPGNEGFAEDALSGQWPRGLLTRMLTSSGAIA